MFRSQCYVFSGQMLNNYFPVRKSLKKKKSTKNAAKTTPVLNFILEIE